MGAPRPPAAPRRGGSLYCSPKQTRARGGRDRGVPDPRLSLSPRGPQCVARVSDRSTTATKKPWRLWTVGLQTGVATSAGPRRRSRVSDLCVTRGPSADPLSQRPTGSGGTSWTGVKGTRILASDGNRVIKNLNRPRLLPSSTLTKLLSASLIFG